MIPTEKMDAYMASVAHFHAMRPDLEGFEPTCAHCAKQQGLQCDVSGEVRRRNAECNTGDFVLDERPLWEQFPHIPKSEWTKSDGMMADTMRRINEYIAAGGSIDDLPTLRTGGVRLVFPPGKRRDEYALPEEAWTEDGYQGDRLTVTLRERLDARTKEAA